MAKRVPSTTGSTVARRWLIEVTEQSHLSANDRSHWRKRHDEARRWREHVAWAAKAERIPALEAVHVTLYVMPPDRRRRDPDNWFPPLKHATDGIRDAGVVVDDDTRRVRRVAIEPVDPDGSKRWRWWVEIREVSP